MVKYVPLQVKLVICSLQRLSCVYTIWRLFLQLVSAWHRPDLFSCCWYHWSSGAAARSEAQVRGPLSGFCRIPSDPEEATSADYLYQALELRLHEASQKAAGLILLCLTLSVAKKGKAWGSNGEFTRHICIVRVDPNLPCAECMCLGWGITEHVAVSLGHCVVYAWSALSFSVLRCSCFVFRTKWEESLDACLTCSAPLNWPLGAWSPNNAPAQAAKELLGLLRHIPDHRSSGTWLLSNQHWAMVQHRALWDPQTLLCLPQCVWWEAGCEQAGAGYLVSADNTGCSNQLLWARYEIA